MYSKGFPQFQVPAGRRRDWNHFLLGAYCGLMLGAALVIWLVSK